MNELELMEAIEDEEYECQAGNLRNNDRWIELKKKIKKSLKHYFKPSQSDKDFCEKCGYNFRNTDIHITAREG